MSNDYKSASLASFKVPDNPRVAKVLTTFATCGLEAMKVDLQCSFHGTIYPTV